MAARSVKYRRYELDILPPTMRGSGWVVMIWPVNREPPIVMPSNASETGAIAAAEAHVDTLLGGPRTPE